MAKTHKEEEKDTVAGVLFAVSALIFVCTLFGFLMVSIVSGVHGWWTEPDAITFDEFIERMDACTERELGVTWSANTDGTYQYVTCKGE